MFEKLKKKRIRKEYENSTKALQLSLYEVIVSILKDELHEEYSIDQIKNAAAITVNNLGLRPEFRPNPLDNNDNLAKSLSKIISLTLIKEATALMLIFSYFLTDKKEEKYLVKAKSLNCSDFEIIYNMLDINKTTLAKVRKLASSVANKLYETAQIDIIKNFSTKASGALINDLPPDMLHSFAKIQEGMELYLTYEMKNRNLPFNQEATKYTFRHLISAEAIPTAKHKVCIEMIEILKGKGFIIDIFKKAMRIKTMLMGKSGMMTEGMNLRMTLLNLGIQISEDQSELPAPEEFVDIANRFYEDCKVRFGS